MRAFRRRGTEYDQQFVLDVGKELEDRKADHARDDAQYHKHEKPGREIERRDKTDQIQDGAGAELADRVGHGPESADRRSLHDDRDDAENPVRRLIDKYAQVFAAFAKTHHGKAEKN